MKKKTFNSFSFSRVICLKYKTAMEAFILVIKCEEKKWKHSLDGTSIFYKNFHISFAEVEK